MDIESIYKEYFTTVYRFARKLSGDADMADELTQETFFKAMKHLNQFKGNCEIKVWLCQICKNTYISELRKGKWFCKVSDDAWDNMEAADNIELQTMDKDTACRIRRIWYDMEEPYKEVFSLRIFGEWSFTDISRLFGKSESWARVTYHRARKKIMEVLSNEDNL